MIYYLATSEARNTIDDFINKNKETKSLPLKVIETDNLKPDNYPSPKPGTWIFSDLERNSLSELKELANFWNYLALSGEPLWLLNHPLAVRKRYEFLRLLKKKKINLFDVYKLTESRDPRFYPVFLRDENTHASVYKPDRLIKTKEDLINLKAQIDQDTNICREELLITEYINCQGEDGLYRKYSAFNIGGEIIPRHIFFSDKIWFLKGPHVVEDQLVKEELTFQKTNPHKEELLKIFRLARIDYGRIDYGFRKGKLQVFEINTNPQLYAPGLHPKREEGSRLFYRKFLKSLKKLPTAGTRRARREKIKSLLRMN